MDLNSILKRGAIAGTIALSILTDFSLTGCSSNRASSLESTVNHRIELFTLAPKLEQVLKNRGKRKINQTEKERIKHHYNIGIPNLSFGVIIDNTNQTPEETAEIIYSKLSNPKSQIKWGFRQ